MKQVPGLGTRLENEGSQVNAAMIHSDSQEPCHHFDRFDGERAACFYCLVPQDDKRTIRGRQTLSPGRSQDTFSADSCVTNKPTLFSHFIDNSG